MALPTTKTDLTRLLDSMQAQGAAQGEMKAVIDAFVSEQKAKTAGSTVPEYLQNAASFIAGQPQVTGAVAEKATTISLAQTIKDLTPEQIAEQIGLDFEDGQIIVRNKSDFEKLPSHLQEGLKEESEQGTLLGVVKGGLDTTEEGLKTIGGGFGEVKEGLFGKDKGLDDRVTETVGGIFDIIGGGLQTAFAFPSEVIGQTPVVGDVFEFGFEKLEEASQFGADKFIELSGVAPESAEAETIKQGFSLLGQLVAIKAAESPKFQSAVGAVAGKGLQAGKVALETGKKVLETAKGLPVVKSALEATGKVKDFTITQLTQLKPETIEIIKNSPDQLKALQEAGSELATVDIFRDFKGKLDQKSKDLSGLGLEYKTIRESGRSYTVADSFWSDWIADQKLTFENGKLGSTSSSKIRKPAEIAELQQFFDTFALDEAGGFRTSYAIEEFLNMRSDTAGLGAQNIFETGANKNLIDGAKDLRSKLNENKSQIEGLAELDAQFAPQIQLINQVKSLVYDSKGNVKPSGVNNVANLLKANKFEKLALVEQLMPGFAEQLKALNALKNIEYAGKSLFSQVKTGGVTTAALTGSIPLALGIVATSPIFIVPLLRTYGKAKIGAGKVLDVIVKKVEEGKALTKSESNTVSKFLEAVTDEEVLAIIAASAGTVEGEVPQE